MKAECPSCGGLVEVKNPKLGKKVICTNCGAELEVGWLDPLELDWVPEEDFDDDDDEYQDEI